MNEDFPRTKRLPTYVCAITNELNAKARGKGEDIIDFGTGSPDQPTPKHIVDKLVEVAQRSSTHRYSMSRGTPRLRRAISNWYKEHYDVALTPETEAIVTPGSKEGLANLTQAMAGKDDTVLIPSPAYPIHPYGFIIAGADIRCVPCEPGYNFFLELEKAIKDTWPKPKTLVINYPSNPTSECVELEFFESVIKVTKEYEIWVIQDLAYADIVYNGYKAPSIFEVQGAKDVAVEFFSLSKSYNMLGWRVGFMVGSATLIGALAKIKSYLDYRIFTPIQVVAIETLEGDQTYVSEIRDMYQHCRGVLCAGIKNIGCDITPPKATMFVWAKIPEFYRYMGLLEFCKALLKQAKVVVSSGIGFGDYGDDYVRACLIEKELRTHQAVRGIRSMFKQDGLL